MQKMNGWLLEFRTLQVFAALMEHRSVSKAARILDIPQPTVSRCLAKLRDHFEDPLFVRTRAGMEPTPTASAVAPSVDEALGVFRSHLLHGARFDPRTVARTFSIAASDVGELLLLSELCPHFESNGYRVRIRTVPLGSIELSRGLESGDVDLAVGGFQELSAGIHVQKLFEEHYVCLVREGHPLARRRLTLGVFKNARHVVVMARTFGHFHEAVEARLQEICPPENVRVMSYSFLVSALLVEKTDLVLTVPSRVAECVAPRGALRRVEPPLELPRFDVKQYWHQRYHNEPGHQWLRRTIRELFAG